jgi:hypothetical protein
MGDSLRGGSDNASSEGKTLYEKASDTAANAYNGVANALSGEQKK